MDTLLVSYLAHKLICYVDILCIVLYISVEWLCAPVARIERDFAKAINRTKLDLP